MRFVQFEKLQVSVKLTYIINLEFQMQQTVMPSGQRGSGRGMSRVAAGGMSRGGVATGIMNTYQKR